MYTNEDIRYVEHFELDVLLLDEKVPKAKILFQTSILPELLGRWFHVHLKMLVPLLQDIQGKLL